jgi:hypothetical protein
VLALGAAAVGVAHDVMAARDAGDFEPGPLQRAVAAAHNLKVAQAKLA